MKDVHMGSYTICALLALLVTAAGFAYSNRGKGIGAARLIMISFCLVASTLFGARLLFILTNAGHGARLLDLEAHEFSLYGGLIAAAFTGILISRFLHVSLWTLADGGSIWIGFGIAIMKVGCILHGCCFGKVAHVLWAVTPPLLSPAHRYQLVSAGGNILFVQPVHPTQVYELLAAISGSIIAIALSRKKQFPGLPALVFIMWLTGWRWIIYYLRAVPAGNVTPYMFYPVMYGMLLMSAAGFFYQRYKFSRKNLPARHIFAIRTPL